MNLLHLLVACHPSPDTGWDFPDRAQGERAPLTAPCDDLDPVRCLLPWPSSAFLAEDPSTATGLRVSIDPSSQLLPDDDPSYVNQADGFSRITGVATAFEAHLDPASLASGPVRLLVAEPSEPTFTSSVPLQLEIVDDGGDLYPSQMVIGRPLQPLAPASEHLVVVLDDLLDADGLPLQADHRARVTLGLDPPESEEEARLAAYYAPSRELLAWADLDPAHVVRMWDFTTRSAEDPRRRLLAMIDAVRASSTTVVLDSAEIRDDGVVAAIVLGHLEGVPAFLTEEDRLVLDAGGLPVVQGTTETVFRVVIPDGEGPWRPVLYGHGTGGEVTDDAFDTDLAAYGLGKVGLRWDGWTSDTFLYTLADFTHWFSGTEASTARLMQSVAGGLGVLDSLDGPLADALSADTLAGQVNPAAGRRPDTSVPVWIGGSQGGTMGAVLSAASDRIGAAVLNVPGAGWTHFIPGSYTDTAYLHALLATSYDGELDIALAILQSQTAWDDVDGASWADRSREQGDTYLMQMSMEDPILLNIGTWILARAEDAVQVEPVLSDLGLEQDPGPVTGHTAITQYRVPDTGIYDVHGFAARDTPAGDAAFEQIWEFLDSVWAGTPTITHPDGCVEVTASGDCDFTGLW